jgi:hypothetical protein
MKLASLDAFPKIESTYVERKRFGGVVSILITLLLCLLVRNEVFEYLGQHQQHEFFVDRHIDQPLQINVDITFAMRCECKTSVASADDIL